MRHAVLHQLNVACGAASHLRLKHRLYHPGQNARVCRMWSGFSSEIETKLLDSDINYENVVACGAASHLRLKHEDIEDAAALVHVVACGAASHLRLKLFAFQVQKSRQGSRMWSGFSSEIETDNVLAPFPLDRKSHVERLLI